MIKTRLVNLLKGAKKYIALQVAAQWTGLVCQIIMIFEVAGIVDALRDGRYMAQMLFRAIAIVLVLCAVRFVSDAAASGFSFKASASVKGTLRGKIYEKLLRLGNSYRDSADTSSIVQTAVEGVDQLETYFGQYLPQLFYSLLAPLTLFVVLMFVNLNAAVILLVFVPLIPVSIVIVQKIAKRLLGKYWGAYEELGDSFLENLQGLTTLKIYESDGMKAEEMDRESEHFRKITMKVLTMQLNSTSVMDIMAYGGAAAGMIAALQQYTVGNVSLGGALSIILLASEFFIPLRRLGSYFHIAMNGMAASDRIFAFLDLPEPEEGTKEPEGEEIGITLSHVHFAYKDSGREGERKERTALRDVSMDLPAGSFTAVVGASGSGKSTIAGILMGRNRGYEGSVMVNGTELRDIKEKALFKTFTYIAHDSVIFKGTVRENLLLAKPDADDDALRKVLETVRLKEFSSKKNGLDTEILEGGRNLSGGQRQRLALARALLADSRVLVLDEAAGNIDLESGEAILSVLAGMKGKKTILMISHRIADAAIADRIFFLQDGTVTEKGTFDDLVSLGGSFAKMYRVQRDLEEYGRSGREVPVTKIRTGGDTRGSSGAAERRAPDTDRSEKEESTEKRRPAVQIMRELITLVKPLVPVMLLAITLGVVGFCCAVFLTITAAGKLMMVSSGLVVTGLFVLPLMAIFRGLLHYGEQYCNHFIAFKLLAIIRHKVFAKLRELAPAKLEGKDRGNLIALITSDIELLEVFYAHTISPVAIAIIMSLVMVIFMGGRSIPAALFTAAGYCVVGILIPALVGKSGGDTGLVYRNAVGDMNSYMLESIRGLDETLQYGAGTRRRDEILRRSTDLSNERKKLNHLEAFQRAFTDFAVEIFSYGLFFLLVWSKEVSGVAPDFLENLVILTTACMGSFGPVIALSNLSGTLNQTLASGERVLKLLEEEPAVREVTGGEEAEEMTGAAFGKVTFGYDENDTILKDISFDLAPGEVLGIHGESGCGKSTILKLLMRFWDPEKGKVTLSGHDIKKLDTADLRTLESYMTQETYLFHRSIAENIAIAKPDASMKEIQEAAKKANIHDFIMTLPQQYDTNAGELGSTLSAGEIQRIGLARAFLHEGDLLLLDEPTSSLDALNEGIVLRSVFEEKKAHPKRAVVLVSHRISTLHQCDRILEMDK